MTFNGRTATVSTSNASNAVTAEAMDPEDTIVIRNGSTVVSNGSSATWQSGENILTIDVVDSSGNSSTYTVKVNR